MFPEGGPPRQDDEQQADLDEEYDVKESAEQTLPPGLYLGESIDPLGNIAVLAGLGPQLQADGERTRHLADLLQRLRELVQQLMRVVDVGRRRRQMSRTGA